MRAILVKVRENRYILPPKQHKLRGKSLRLSSGQSTMIVGPLALGAAV
jgi:hypothetical protein